MEQIWKEMFQAAKAVQNGRQISDYVDGYLNVCACEKI